MDLRAEDVFRPGAFPEYTYVSRKSTFSNLSYEFHLNQAIKVSGFLTSLVGPSKMGKTILCEKVIGFDNIVEISGADFDEDTDFWRLVSAKAGLSYEGKFTSEKTIDSTQDKYMKQEEFYLTKDKIKEIPQMSSKESEKKDSSNKDEYIGYIVKKLKECNYAGPVTIETTYRNDYLKKTPIEFYKSAYDAAKKVSDIFND